jgi:hypothetical protein
VHDEEQEGQHKMAIVTELVCELKTLRKGRGVFVGQIADRVGAALRDVCHVTDDDGPTVIRRKVATTLQVLASDLPADLRVAVMVAFGIFPDARLPLYQDRVSWAAVRLNRDPRTVRRRIDDGIARLAELASLTSVEVPAQRLAAAPPSLRSGWHTAEIRTIVTLDRSRPQVLEQRRVVADRDGVSEIDLAITHPARDEEIDVLVLYGGTLNAAGPGPGDRRTPTFSLPRKLTPGETHDYALSYRLPAAGPHFVCVPRRPCEIFDLRVRFDRAHLPARIRRITDGFQRDLDDPAFYGPAVPVDPAGEIRMIFRDLTPGLVYGVRWD